MKRSLVWAALAAVLIVSMIGCGGKTNVYPLLPSTASVSQNNSVLYPARPEGPGRLTAFHEQAGGVWWLTFVYRGYQREEDLWNIIDGRLSPRADYIAAITVGPPHDRRYYTYGVVQLESRQIYSVLAFPLSAGNELLDRPMFQRVEPTGRVQYPFDRGGLVTFCDVCVVFPHVNVQRANPFNVRVFIRPSDYYGPVVEGVLERLFRRR